LNRDLGFSDADRAENIRRVGELARLFNHAGMIVLVAAISPFREGRDAARALVEPGRFVEVYVDTPIEIAEQRDVKGLYKKARSGQLPNFTGIDSPYESPESPEVRIDPSFVTADAAADEVLRVLEAMDLL
jgi:bifunctional enzyme CysN/CysC